MRYLLSFVFAAALAQPASAADVWPSWRGPAGNGTAPADDYPTSWSTDENVAWKVDLPGGAGSTPTVWNDLIVLTTPRDGKNYILAYNMSGELQWATPLGDERPGKHRKGSGSNPSPVTDGERVFVYFKSGDFAALDFEGNVLWHHNLQEKYGEDTLWWDLGTSPVLTSKHVVVACMQTGPSYLAAFDPATGEVAWKVDRNLGAPSEAAQSYSTPVVTQHDGREILVVLGADHVTAHDAADGKLLWKISGMNPEGNEYFRSIASPVVEGDLVIAPYARGNTLTAIRMGGSGDVTKSHTVWAHDEGELSADVPTPAAKDGRVYVCDDKGTVSCLDVATGKVIAQRQLPKNRNAYSASPILAGEYLYLIREDGTAYVLKANDELELVSENELGEFTVATPAFVDGRILIRSFDRLWCIAK